MPQRKSINDMAIVSAGSFYRGMIPDVIGAKDSLVLLEDGWIDRAGEIRKRGGKSLYELADLGDVGFTGRGSALWATFKGEDVWAIAWASENGTIAKVNGEPAGMIASIGDPTKIVSATNFERHIVFGSDGDVSGAFGGSNRIWAGAMSAPSGNFTITTDTASRIVTHTSATLNSNLVPGTFVQLTDSVPSFPLSEDDKIYYTVVSVDTNSFELDRKPHKSYTGASHYSVLAQLYPSLTTDTTPVVFNNGRHVCTHNDRLFLGNLESEPAAESRIRWSGTILDGDKVNGRTDLHLWKEEAYLDVYPGIGGPIHGLHSFNGTLVIVKARAVFILRGDVATNGYDLGARIDKITEHSGAEIAGASVTTPVGVAWADRAGLYVWSGSTINDLTEGRVESVWRSYFGSNPPTVLSSTSDRIIVQNADRTLIYDLEKDLFVTQNAGLFTNILEAPSGLELSVENLANGSPVADTNIINWADDFANNSEDDENHVDRPRLQVITQPLSPTYPFYDDRPNNLMVSGYIDNSAGDEPYLQASIINGRNELDQSGDAEQILEYGFRKRGYDNSERIPIPGTADRPAQRYRLQQVNAAEDIRIYGIGAEYRGTFIPESENDTGATSYGS